MNVGGVRAAARGANVGWLCSPNNPTALAEPDGAIERLLAGILEDAAGDRDGRAAAPAGTPRRRGGPRPAGAGGGTIRRLGEGSLGAPEGDREAGPAAPWDAAEGAGAPPLVVLDEA